VIAEDRATSCIVQVCRETWRQLPTSKTKSRDRTELYFGYPLVVIVKGNGVLGQEGDHYVIGLVAEIVNERRDPVGIDGLERVEQYDRHRLVQIVSKIARQREY